MVKVNILYSTSSLSGKNVDVDKNKYLSKLRDYVTRLGNKMCSQLNINANILIQLKGEFGESRKHLHGYTAIYPKGKPSNNRIALILIDDIDLLIGNVAHELKHISQINAGRLYYNGSTIYFDDIEMSIRQYKKLAKTSHDAYKQIPWEAESYLFGKRWQNISDRLSKKYFTQSDLEDWYRLYAQKNYMNK